MKKRIEFNHYQENDELHLYLKKKRNKKTSKECDYDGLYEKLNPLNVNMRWKKS